MMITFSLLRSIIDTHTPTAEKDRQTENSKMMMMMMLMSNDVDEHKTVLQAAVAV